MPRLPDNAFRIVLEKFYQGLSPAAHLNSLTELGNSGHASTMTSVDVLDPTYMTQGPALSNLTAGTQAGAVSELINFILDRAVSADLTYGIGPTKLFSLTSAAVTNDGTFPHAITNATDGESVASFQGNVYYFYNKSSGADVGKYTSPSTFDDDWGSTVPTGAAALQSAPHPNAQKEDILVFGNGRYLGTYVSATNTLAPTKLDFGAGNEVADVVFHANQWWIAVNAGTTGTNRSTSQIFLYDGGAITSVLADETAVGPQRIGFLYVLNGIVYVAYQDLSFTGGYKIGYVSGRRIIPISKFTGSLPNYAQKTLYKDTILFASSGALLSCGASIEELPVQISNHADGGYATLGAVAAPFGTPMVASTDGATNFRLAKFSGYDTACAWKSIVIPTVKGRQMGYIDYVVVETKHLGANARADLTIEANQGQTSSTSKTITTAGKRLHVFGELGLPAIEDFRVALTWANGNASNDCAIRRITVLGHWVER